MEHEKLPATEKARPKKQRRIRLRTISQITIFVFVAIVSVTKWITENGIAIPFLPEISLHAICPFGGVVTIYEFVTVGTFIQKIHSSSFILMILGIITALLFGAIFCGYICPFGAYQEWIGKIGKYLFPKKYNRLIPARLDKVLRYLRYAVLAMVLYQTATTAKLIFQDMDPYYALFNFFTNEVAVTAYAVLGVMTILSLFIERPWCKYFCPYGAFLGIFNLLSVFRIRRNKTTCIDCRLCDKACPMNIKVSDKATVRDHQCISCHLCTSEAACPVKDTVVIAVKKKEVADEN
ncbi:MAG: 4Fe-4S binding protein [Saccharofermentanales bacterium]